MLIFRPEGLKRLRFSLFHSLLVFPALVVSYYIGLGEFD